MPDALAGWRVKAKQLWVETRKLYGGLAYGVKDKIARDEIEDCFCKELWQNQKEWNLDDNVYTLLWFNFYV